METGGRFINSYALLNPGALKISMFYTNRIFQCMGEIFCVEFQRCPLKFHAKYLTHTLKDIFLYKTEILRALKSKSSHAFFETPPGHNIYCACSGRRTFQRQNDNDTPLAWSLKAPVLLWKQYLYYVPENYAYRSRCSVMWLLLLPI